MSEDTNGNWHEPKDDQRYEATADSPPAPSAIQQALHWAQNNGGIMPAHVLKAAVLQLAAENEALKAALKPFADAYSVLDQLPDSDWACDVSGYEGDEKAVAKLRVHHFKAAARALKAEDGA